MRALRTLLVTVTTVGMLSAAAYGAGYALRPHDSTPRASAADPAPPDTGTPGETPTETPTATPEPPSPSPTPENVLEPGAGGEQVRELQSRLYQLDWLPETTTGRYDPATREAVQGFQAKRGFRGTGVVDQRTWRRLVAMTEQPTHDQLYNVFHPGPPILRSGDQGPDVRDLQARLVSIQWLFGKVSGRYDDTTVEAVRGFQEKRGIPVTGKVDQRTLDRLQAMTLTPTREAMYNLGNKPGALDDRCKEGRVLCIDKTSQTLRWVVDGEVRQTLDVRFGASYSPTREGVFHVYMKDADHVSRLYGSEMPYSMFFSGGQAVHYSSDFAARGYEGASHGCVNVRDLDRLKWLYGQVNVGDAVVVYWS